MLKILLAEDEVHIAKLIEFKLRKAGFEVIIAKDGQEALDLYAAGGWSLLMLDIMMPRFTGLEVLSRVRASGGAGAAIPVLMLTAKGRPVDAAHAADLGATRFLRKPFDPEELVKTVREMLATGEST